MGLNNNHLTDFKEKPINFTISLLKKIGIKTFGYTRGTVNENRPQVPLIIKAKGVTIGFLGYCDIFMIVNPERFHYTCIIRQGNGTIGPSIYTDENAIRDVIALKKKVDVVAVVMHWGVEHQLTNLSESQLRIYVHLRNLGVQLVIGSHPHVLQAHTIAKSSFTAFSLGNFLFEPTGPTRYEPSSFYYNKDPAPKIFKGFMKYVMANPNLPNLQSRILRVRVNKKGFVSAQYLPLKIGFDNRLPDFKCFRPQPLQPARWIDVCRKNDKECLRFQTGL
ncbi:Capsule biosynthesis protein CapA [Exaiptasia diaphana]|nr:Capsule biosynthesis protein CapA [Exaiptasia diaphana]